MNRMHAMPYLAAMLNEGGISLYSRPRQPSQMELRPLEEHQARKAAAELKRQRKAQKLAHAQAMGGIRGKPAHTIIVNDLVVP